MPRKKKNRNLCTAKVRKQDEFYTDRGDIEKELVHYTKSFQGKTIYCCADNPAKSAFWFFFHENFQRLGLKRLIATFYGEGAYQMTYEGGGRYPSESPGRWRLPAGRVPDHPQGE